MALSVVLLDANVLIPLDPRDTILRAAQSGLCQVHWTEQILAETERNLPKLLKDEDEAERRVKAVRLITALRTAFPGAPITGYESAISRMTNDPSDRHVVAAAAFARVDAIVTFNIKHFPPAALAPFHLRAVEPDDFLVELFASAPDTFAAILRKQEVVRIRPKRTATEILAGMETRMPRFVGAMRQRLAEESPGSLMS